MARRTSGRFVSCFASLKDTVDSARKFGVRHHGIALLVAYCLEVLQHLHFG